MSNTAAVEKLKLIAKVEERPEVRDCTGYAVGDVYRQGDVYIHKISNEPMADLEVIQNNQLAEGATKGSRHCADAPATVRAIPAKRLPEYLRAMPARFLGPAVVSDKPWNLSHPEHAHALFGPGTYVSTFQLDARTLDRVRD